MKHRKTYIVISILLLAMLLVLSGCRSAGGAASPTPTAVSQEPVKAASTNVADGSVVPVRQVNLSFSTSGVVDEVQAVEGQTVKAGQVIARLKGNEQLNSAVVAAELAVLSAQQELDDLNKNADQDRIQALQAVSDAAKAVRDAKYQLDNFTVPTSINKLDTMQAVDVTSQKLDDAQKAFNPYRNDPENSQTRKDLKQKLDGAQADYNAAVRHLELDTAYTAAQATLAKTLKDYETLKSGTDPEKLALAQARVKNAQAQLTSAKAASDDLTLLAPFDGIIISSELEKGMYVSPATSQVELADLSKWQIETSDLVELKVVNIQEGDPVAITFDAIPDLHLTGKVLRIKPLGVNKQGDITYTVVVTPDQQDPRLRWNMTAVVDFNK